MKIIKPEDALLSTLKEKNLDVLFSKVPLTDTESDIEFSTRDIFRNNILTIMDSINAQMGDVDDLLFSYYARSQQEEQPCCTIVFSEKDEMPLVYLLHMCKVAEQLLTDVGWVCQIILDTDVEERSVTLNVFWSAKSINSFYKRLYRETFV